MGNNFENNSAMLKSADPERSADSLIGNQASPSLEQLDYKEKRQKEQRKFHEIIDKKEHKKADEDLENKLLTLGISVNKKEIEKTTNDSLHINKELSNEDRIKAYTETIRQGKSQTEILSLLIAKFENEEAVSTWVENWRNFQKLHRFAESKSPKERKVIERIISKADFTSETAFSTSLLEIAQSKEISDETKLKISREFNGANVFSVNDFNNTLQEVKTHKQKIENAISTKSHEKEFLDSEINELKSKIEKLPLSDPKRQELEQKLEQKKTVLKQTESEIDSLEKAKPKNVSFQLREGVFAKLNPDGTRSIQLNSRDFAIKLPSNFLPFTDMKNMRSINLAFPFLALKNQNIARFLFQPNLISNQVPSNENRKMGHLILNSLGFDDSKIITEENIKQLNTDLARLTSIPAKTGKECLIEFGVFDIVSQSLSQKRLLEVLGHIRENRGLEKELFLERIT